METRLNLIVLRSPDIDKLRQFYQALGLQFAEEKHGTGSVHYSCNIGEVLLELYPTTRNADTAGVGFTVPNLEAAVAMILDIDHKYISKTPFDSEYGRTAEVRDPDGRLVRLLERSYNRKPK